MRVEEVRERLRAAGAGPTHEFRVLRLWSQALPQSAGKRRLEDFLPAMLKPLLAGNTSFDIAGTRTKSGGIDIERANLTSEALRAIASGSLDPAGAADLSVSVNANGAPIVLSAFEPSGENPSGVIGSGGATSPIGLAAAGATQTIGAKLIGSPRCSSNGSVTVAVAITQSK